MSKLNRSSDFSPGMRDPSRRRSLRSSHLRGTREAEVEERARNLKFRLSSY